MSRSSETSAENRLACVACTRPQMTGALWAGPSSQVVAKEQRVRLTVSHLGRGGGYCCCCCSYCRYCSGWRVVPKEAARAQSQMAHFSRKMRRTVETLNPLKRWKRGRGSELYMHTRMYIHAMRICSRSLSLFLLLHFYPTEHHNSTNIFICYL